MSVSQKDFIIIIQSLYLWLNLIGGCVKVIESFFFVNSGLVSFSTLKVILVDDSAMMRSYNLYDRLQSTSVVLLASLYFQPIDLLDFTRVTDCWLFLRLKLRYDSKLLFLGNGPLLSLRCPDWLSIWIRPVLLS